MNMGLSTATRFPQFVTAYFFLISVFVLMLLGFLPIGQLCGRLMTRKEKLPAYGLNLLGSLAGILLMFVLSHFWTGPVVWFGLSFCMLFLFQLFDTRVFAIGSFFAIVALIFLASSPANAL